ncbi:hypothetical protein MKX03_022898 [Papaver bracteatum]|nr:hypothetical protein MKX03_022898 [Papaver bracteatum]
MRWDGFSSYNVMFNYEGRIHILIQVNATAYDKCLKELNLGESRNRNDTVALAKVGRIWFLCRMADHREFGQRFSVDVLP